MTTSEILDDFDKLTDEMSELSPDQKLALADSKYRDVLNDRDWEFLRTEGSAVVTAGEIAIPADFRNFAENNKTKYRFGFWIGTLNSASFYPVVNMQDRRVRTDMSYFDARNSKIVLAEGLSLNGQTATFDYFYKPNALTVDTSPVFNSDHHKVIPYLMAGEHYLIDQTEAGRTQKDNYDALAQEVIEDMQYEDDQLKEDWLTH